MNPPSYSELASQGSPAQTVTEGIEGSPPATSGMAPAVGIPMAGAQVLKLECPNCRHPLNLRREHLGVEGHCVGCGQPLVAVERPDSGVVLENPSQPAPSPAPAGLSHAVPASLDPRPAPAPAEQIPTSDNPEPTEPHGTDSGPKVWSSPEPRNQSEVSGLAASMIGFTGSSNRNQLPDTNIAVPSETVGSPKATPGSNDSAPAEPVSGEKSPWSPFANQSEPSVPPSGTSKTQPEAPELSPGNDNASERDSSPFARGLASLFKGSISGPVDSPTPPGSTATDAEIPEGSTPQSPLPWDSTGASVPSTALPAESRPPVNSDPLNLQWKSPLSAESGTAETANPEPEGKADSSENKAQPETEKSAAAKPEPVKKSNWFSRSKSDKPASVPGAAFSDFGRRRTLGRPRRGFGRFLLKIVVTFFLVVGLVVGGYFFTPPEKIEVWKTQLIEFLKPGAVLKDYLPFKVPFLEKLAEEESKKTAPPQQKNLPAPGVLPSAEIRPGPTPQSAVPAIPKKIRTVRSDEFGPGLATVGQIAVERFYGGKTIEERSAMLLDPKRSLPAMRAFYQRYQSLPTLKSIAYRGPIRDADSGRWFAVLDVRENENEEVHRWAAMFNEAGELKLDWRLYQQLRDDALARFLTDPAAPPKTLRLLVRRGGPASAKSNPWNSPAVTLLLQTPLDDGHSPKKIIMRQSEFDRLGLAPQLPGFQSKVAEVELAWIDSDTQPVKRIATIQKIIGWGAWR